MDTSVQQKKLYAAIMNLRIAFEDYANIEGNVKINALSNILRLSAPQIIRNGGRITRISEEGIASVFENGTEDAIQTALEFFGNASRCLSSTEIDTLSIGIHAGDVYIAELNYNDRIFPVAMSEGIRLSRYLSDIAVRYESKILITKTASGSVRSFENRFSSRKLGIVHSKATGEDELIYDIFDSDPTDLKYRKKRSRLVFETGVSLFLQEKYLQSRSYFIELLKFDRNDSTAKKYIFMCDNALSKKGAHVNNKYLEIW